MLARWCRVAAPLISHRRATLARGVAGAGGPAKGDADAGDHPALSALDAAWTAVASSGRPGLADAEAVLEEAVLKTGSSSGATTTPATVRAALNDSLASVLFLRGARPDAAEAAAAAAVAAAAADASASSALVARCRARHGATLVSLGRYGEAAAVLDAGEASPEAGFFRALAAAATVREGGGDGGGSSSSSSSSTDLPTALVAAIVTHPPPPAVAPLLEAAALRELRRAVDGAVAAGETGRAVDLAAAEVGAHAALAAARAAAAESGAPPPDVGATIPPPLTDTALHAQYRWATLLFAAGGGDAGSDTSSSVITTATAVEAASAAVTAADAAWGADDDRSVLRAHRLAVARAVALVESASSSAPSPALPFTPATVEAAAVRARDRFRRKLGRGAGLAGEAGLAAALARWVGLSNDGEGATTTDAFTAVLLPRRRKEAVTEVEAQMAVMRGAYGPAHPLSQRLGRVVEQVVAAERERRERERVGRGN